MSSSQERSRFWDDLDEGLKDPAFRDAYIAAALEIAAKDRARNSHASSLRDQIAETLRNAVDHQIVAEWICCDPVRRDHKLCVKGDKLRQMMRGLLTDDPEYHPPISPILDALMAAIQAALDERDAEIERLRASIEHLKGDFRKQRERAEQAEVERDRLKAAIEKAVNEDYDCGGACEYGRGCPYMPDLETALDQPQEKP